MSTGPLGNKSPEGYIDTNAEMNALRKAFSEDYSADLTRKALSLDHTLKRETIHHLNWNAFRAGYQHARKTK